MDIKVICAQASGPASESFHYLGSLWLSAMLINNIILTLGPSALIVYSPSSFNSFVVKPNVSSEPGNASHFVLDNIIISPLLIKLPVIHEMIKALPDFETSDQSYSTCD